MCKNTTSSTMNHVSSLLPIWKAVSWMGRLRQNRSWTRPYLWGLHKGFSEGNAAWRTVQTLTKVVDWKKRSWHAIKDCAYNRNRLEWHLGDEADLNPAGYCVVLSYGKRVFWLASIALLLLSPRAKTTEHLAGFLLLDNTMRCCRWLCLRYPATRANQSRGRGRTLERGGWNSLR